MKIIFLILAVICGSCLANIIPSINFDLKEQKERINGNIIIDNIKQQMQYGFPDLGIPVLAPLQKPYDEMFYSNKLVEMIAILNDLQVYGLDVFDVNEINLSVLTLKATFNFNFNEIYARSQYLVNAFLLSAFKISGNGGLDVTLRDLNVTGSGRITYKSGILQIEHLNIVIKLGKLHSNISGLKWGNLTGKLANEAFETFIAMIIRTKPELISDIVETMITEKGNKLLTGMTITDLLDLIQNSMKPVDCVPHEKNLVQLENK